MNPTLSKTLQLYYHRKLHAGYGSCQPIIYVAAFPPPGSTNRATTNYLWLYTFHQTPLRRPTEVSRYGNVVIFLGTNIPRGSSQIYNETRPIFYRVNHFHLEQALEGYSEGQCSNEYRLPLVFRQSLHMMRHLSIDPIQRLPDGKRGNWRILVCLEDVILTDILVQIGMSAPNLRTLALHFGPFAVRDMEFPFLLAKADKLVISILCHLHARLSRLSLVYFGEPTALKELRSNIAPLKDWTAQTLEYWPVTKPPGVIKEINSWQARPDLDMRIRVWDLFCHPGLHACKEHLGTCGGYVIIRAACSYPPSSTLP